MPLRASKRSLELWDPISIYRGGKTLKKRHGRLKYEFGRILLRKGWKGYALSSLEGSWAKAQKGATRHSKSAIRCSWMPNILPCAGAFWTLFLGFFDPVLVSRRVFILSLWFFFLISLLDSSGFFRNNYLVDKYPKINLDKVQIIHNFIVI